MNFKNLPLMNHKEHYIYDPKIFVEVPIFSATKRAHNKIQQRKQTTFAEVSM